MLTAKTRRLQLLSSGALALVLAGSGACGVDDAADAPPVVAGNAAIGIAPIDTSGIVWSMEPRAAAAAAAYRVVNHHETYGTYARPTTFNVNLSWTPPPVAPGGPVTLLPQYQWVVTQSAPPTPGQGQYQVSTPWNSVIGVRAPVPQQGLYDVKLYRRALGGSTALVTSTTINVKDIVIVDVGDSMASGEGDADVWQKYRRAYLTVNGQSGVFGPEFQYGDPLPPATAGVDYPAGSSLVVTKVKDAVWMEPTCHRSMHSGTARAAIEYEQRNPHVSVTFLDYACSGAKTYNLYQTPQHAAEGLSYTQFDNLKYDLDNHDGTYRQADFMIMSIGINDLRFHDIMENCLKPNYGGCEKDEPDVAERFSSLDAAYDKLQLGIYTNLNGIVKTVSLIDYPATNEFKNEEGMLEACGFTDGWDVTDESHGAPVPKNLSHDELNWLLTIGERLVAMAPQNARSNEWDYIAHIDQQFEGRGYCADYPTRYYNVFTESEKKQGDENGIFHPNNFGYTAMGHVIADYLSQPRFVVQPLWGNTVSWSTDFSNPAGWSLPQYASTIRFPDVNGDHKADVCGRGTTGIFCALSNGSGFGPATRWSTYFTDAGGWAQPQYYSTITFPDLNHDGKADICGRASDGMHCAFSNGTSFDPVILSSPDFTNAQGWDQPGSYTTLRAQNVNQDPGDDLCGLAGDGIWCLTSGPFLYLGTRTAWETRGTADPYVAYSRFDSGGPPQNPSFYSNIRFPDLDGDGMADVCGHTTSVSSATDHTGIFCAHSDGRKFEHLGFFNHESLFESNGWWTSPEYYKTIEYPDVNGDGMADVCARAPSIDENGTHGGIVCATSNGHSFEHQKTWTWRFSDEEGWGTDPSYYDTLQYGDINGDGMDDVCGRGSSGVYCAFSTGDSFTGYTRVDSSLTDVAGFNGSSFYPTMQLADVTGTGVKKVCIRSYWGISCQR